LTVPSGTTAQRPATATNGMIRYNTTESKLETYTTDWVPFNIGMYALYAFTTHTFTNVGVPLTGITTARFGPTLNNLKDVYTPNWTGDINYLNVVTTGFQLWTVPADGTYRITAKGAQGGKITPSGTYANNVPGNGASIQADITFTEGTKIVIIVGQTPVIPTNSNLNSTGGGGGGATWILKENFTTANDQVYMVAGGGGGAQSPQYAIGASGSADGSSQGTLGAGGVGNQYASGFQEGGGAGWTSNGGGTGGGQNPANGATGGIHGYGTWESQGGFGGGGGNGVQLGGGGAGASGGRSALTRPGLIADLAQGGTSYIITTATNPTFSGTHTDEDGSVYIQAPGQF
jgi:hypothetical protein